MMLAQVSLVRILEGVLLACEEPLPLERLETLFDEHERPSRRALKEALTLLGERLDGGALELQESASGYRLRIRAELSPWVSRLWEERPQRYSRALLETLALIAYRQPVTRGDIEEVRGVSISASIMRTLSERGWIRVIGHRDVPGRPAVYATTRAFLDDFGLKTLDELPPMHELKQGETLDWLDQGAGEGRAATAVDSNAEHAATASTQQSLSFAALGERLAARTRGDASEPHEADVDADDVSAEANIHLDDETSPDS